MHGVGGGIVSVPRPNTRLSLFAAISFRIFGQGGVPTLTSGGVTGINLSGTSLSNLGAQNAGAVIGAITITGHQTTAITLGGTDAAKFAITNGGFVPCNLIAAVDIPAGSYSITLTAT